jgi:hypothetical protein
MRRGLPFDFTTFFKVEKDDNLIGLFKSQQGQEPTPSLKP